MPAMHQWVEWGVIGLLVTLSMMAVAIGLERHRTLKALDARRYTSRARLEADLTERLNVISTIAVNAPYIGLLGTVIGIMFTFAELGGPGQMDVKSIMTGLALALKATAVGIGVAMPCVAINNQLRRQVRLKLADYDEAHGA